MPVSRKPLMPEGDYPPGGYFEDPSLFDAAAFGIPPSEARQMDPQQRMALELSEECIEDAGSSRNRVFGANAGVFAGATWREYGYGANSAGKAATSLTGTASGSIAGRISQSFGFTGPSLAVDSITSSSLSAVHLACQSLASGECDMALALGVNLILGPDSGQALKAMGVLSREDTIRPFDQLSDGYQRGEGVAAVLLKRLPDALRTGDSIHATIRASAIGHNGGGPFSLATPSSEAQRRLLSECLRRAELTAGDLAYWEAHGTGTHAGDAAEARALRQTMISRREPLAIGSVKGNLGHVEAAAGIAGLLSAILVSRTRELPVTRGHRQPSFPGHELWVPTRRSPLPDGSGAAIGVTSLGLAGSNACLIIEPGDRHALDADLPPREWAHRPYWLSNGTEDALGPREILSSVLGCSFSVEDEAATLLDLGMDSLSAMELETQLRSAGYRISARELLGGATLADVESRAAASNFAEVRI